VHGDIFCKCAGEGETHFVVVYFHGCFFTTNFDASDKYVHATNVGVCPKD
jgi:hypothetical protein